MFNKSLKTTVLNYNTILYIVLCKSKESEEGMNTNDNYFFLIDFGICFVTLDTLVTTTLVLSIFMAHFYGNQYYNVKIICGNWKGSCNL